MRRSEVSSGADLSADAGKNIEVSASTLTAEGDLALTAEGSVGLSAQADEFHEEVHKKTSGLQKGKMDGTEAVVTHQVTELSSGGDLAVTAKSGDVALEATRVASAGSATSSPEDGLVGMLSVTDSDFKSVSKTGSNLVRQSAAGTGHDDTTVRMVAIDAGGGDFEARAQVRWTVSTPACSRPTPVRLCSSSPPDSAVRSVKAERSRTSAPATSSGSSRGKSTGTARRRRPP
ncbi:hypothetical protein KL86APRO_30434 [uncultured Alphaproteobacteria bacterium]|uniref:Uncharacterized protein n=1 Tax=uncultured Alphaproteobacteria bacterium TaxID=91750 RepID=A0A212KML1_9PROT|nr:hypothetical protein KL86APRO_30434 [uncultured Alphaproteobacteria bacterium]